jgi:hypothetical protein
MTLQRLVKVARQVRPASLPVDAHEAVAPPSVEEFADLAVIAAAVPLPQDAGRHDARS